MTGRRRQQKMNWFPCPLIGMPSRGVDIIDGIPVSLKGDVIYAFHAPGQLQKDIRLGTYDSVNKKATWEQVDTTEWVVTFREGLISRSRK